MSLPLGLSAWSPVFQGRSSDEVFGPDYWFSCRSGFSFPLFWATSRVERWLLYEPLQLLRTTMNRRQTLKRAARYERVLYRLRVRSQYYYEIGKADKVSKLINRCKLLATPLWVLRQKKRQVQFNAAFTGSY